MTAVLRVATWNIHRGIGMDRRFMPDRIAAVMAELDADIVALQEVGARDAGFDMLAHLAQASGHGPVSGVTFSDHRGDFGNALLTRLPIVAIDRHSLCVGRREPRLALVVELDGATTPLRIVATHLGLRASERQAQVARLVDLLRELPEMPTILAGDMNAWSRGKRESQPLDNYFGHGVRIATFPAIVPCLALDRIWLHPGKALVSMHAHRSPAARLASDHLPLVAEVEFPDAGSAR